MRADLLSRVQDGYTDFSKSQKAIADFLLSHYDKAAFMTAYALGRAVSVSESTVVRFAVELGYDGYPKMQKALQELIRSRLTSTQRMEVMADRIGGHNLLQTVLLSDMEKIRQTLDDMEPQAFDEAVAALLNARSIYVLGVRSSAALAQFFAFYARLMFDNVKLLNTSSVAETMEQALHIGPQDLFVGIGFPRYSRSTLQVMRFVRDKNARILAVTDCESSPLAQMADIKLYAKSDMVSFADSLVAPLSLLNALIVALSMRKREEISDVFSQLEHIWDTQDVYEKTDAR